MASAIDRISMFNLGIQMGAGVKAFTVNSVYQLFTVWQTGAFLSFFQANK
jgi:hypothetical protein